ncbi:MAG: hypothetical protein PPP56_09455 [Longimonas sp.]|uniref:hypothetical protein n=1 Tax=Longimonas sp. TaxID=2039626 RepID=UPI0033623675
MRHLSHTHRIGTLLTMAALLLSSLAPIAQHVCAQMMQQGSTTSMLMCCCPTDSGEAENTHDAHDAAPCPDHAPEPTDVFVSGEACCDIEMQQAASEAVHPRATVVHDMQVASASLHAAVAPNVQHATVAPLSDRAPPLTARQSLVIHNSSFLI